MADSTPRLDIPHPEGGDSPPDVAQALADLTARLDAITMSRDQGPISGRAPAGTPGRMYWSTSSGVDGGMSYDDGAAWRAIPGPGLIPIGGTLDWPWAAEPPGPAEWVEMDGRTLTKSAYPELFAAIGISGETLVVQDRRGRSPMGAGLGSGLTTSRIVGSLVGGETVTLSVAQLPSHGHGATAVGAPNHDHGGLTNPSGVHQHGYGYGGWTSTITASGWIEGGVYSVIRNPGTFSNATDAAGEHQHIIWGDGAHTHTVTVHPVGNGAPVGVIHPSAVTRYYLRVR